MSWIIQSLIASYPSTSLWGGLVAYYKLDSNSNDSVGTNNGTDTNVSYVTGKISNGASGNGTSSFISAWTTIDGGTVSISFWLKMNVEIGSGSNHFFSQRNNNTKTGYFVSYDFNGGTRRIWFARQKPAVATNIVYSNQTLGTTNWNHFTLTYNWTIVTGYFNGTSIGTIASSGNWTWTVTTWINLLRDIEWWSLFTNWIIDEVGIWNRAITASEVTTLYNSGSWITY